MKPIYLEALIPIAIAIVVFCVVCFEAGFYMAAKQHHEELQEIHQSFYEAWK